jgi:F-type H+-transporting ATPase subunit b
METRALCRRLSLALMVAASLAALATPRPLAASAQPEQPGHAATAESSHAPQGGEHAAEAHGESTLAFIARIANFLILAGGLYYLLRSPVGKYLEARSQQIRSDLEHAAATRREAAERLAALETRLKALPGELEALKARGKEEMATEEARIRAVAEAERQRLVEQTRREVDRQVQLARRELTEHAADLAVGVARARLSRELTEAEHLKLIDRYASQVSTRHE